MRNIMGINVGMLIFGLIDGTLAFAIVFHLIKARFKGGKFGRILGTILGTIVFANYIALQPPKNQNSEEETDEAANEGDGTVKQSATPDDLTAAEENS